MIDHLFNGDIMHYIADIKCYTLSDLFYWSFDGIPRVSVVLLTLKQYLWHVNNMRS